MADAPVKPPAVRSPAATGALVQPTSSTSTQPARRVANAPFQISSIRTNDRWLKILIYGAHGAGKTTLAGSAADVPAMNDVFMINAEAGELVLENNPRVKHPERIDFAGVDNFKQVAKMYEFLSAHCKHRDSNNVEMMRKQEAWLRGCDPEDIVEPKRYRTVIIDSLTEVEAYCMYMLLGIASTTADFDISQIDEEMKTAEFAEYKKNNNMVNLLVRAFRDLPMHVIVLCGQAYEQDELKRFHYFPTLTGKLRSQIQGYFDIVGYLMSGQAAEGQEAPRRLYVQPVGKWDAKNRRAGFKDPFFQDPTMGNILKKVGLLQGAVEG